LNRAFISQLASVFIIWVVFPIVVLMSRSRDYLKFIHAREFMCLMLQLRQELEKIRRRLEAELADVREQLGEKTSQLEELQAQMNRREEELQKTLNR
jgi:septal ring factor EnvC (AmiA/AmiB activator)